MLVNVLEKERGVIASKVPRGIEDWILGTVEWADSWMHKVFKVVVVAVDGDGTFAYELVADCATMKSVCWLATYCFCETKGKKAYACHQDENNG